MPVGMHDLYHRLLSQMEDTSDTQKRIGKVTIAILLKANRPVSFTDICGMLKRALQPQIDPETNFDTAYLMEACGGFISIDSSGRDLSFIYSSAKDFLISSARFRDVELPAEAENSWMARFHLKKHNFRHHLLKFLCPSITTMWKKRRLAVHGLRTSSPMHLLSHHSPQFFSQLETDGSIC